MALQLIPAGSAPKDAERLECGPVPTDGAECRRFILNSLWRLQRKVGKSMGILDSATTVYKDVKQKRQTRADKVHSKCRKNRGINEEALLNALCPIWSPLGTCFFS